MSEWMNERVQSSPIFSLLTFSSVVNSCLAKNTLVNVYVGLPVATYIGLSLDTA